MPRKPKLKEFDVAIYFKLLGPSEEEVDDLVRLFARQFKSKHRTRFVPDKLTEKGSIVIEVDK